MVEHSGKHQNVKVHQGDHLRYGKLVLSRDSALKLTSVEEYQNTPTGGYIGVAKRSSRLNANVTWEGMKKDITNFIANSHIYEQIKYII